MFILDTTVTTAQVFILRNLFGQQPRINPPPLPTTQAQRAELLEELLSIVSRPPQDQRNPRRSAFLFEQLIRTQDIGYLKLPLTHLIEISLFMKDKY